MTHRRLRVEDASQVAEARREAVALARSIGFDETRAGTVALAVTEAATNLVKHAGGGQIIVGRVTASESPGIEVYVLDRGPGIPNVAASLRDGESTTGTAGLGLGSLSRLTTAFDVYTQRGKGTVLHFEIWAGREPPVRRDGVDPAVVCVPKSGEAVSGDAWLLREEKGRTLLMIADGLGHGPEAALAANTARKIAWECWNEPPATIIDAMHHALKSTRGAAGAVVVLKAASEVGVFCGVGNISCFTRAAGTSRNLVSHNGTLGHHVRKIQEFSFPFPRKSLLLAHSDGVGTHWGVEDYPALESRSPAIVAGAVFRDHERGRDDATLAVLRNEAL